MPTDLPDPAVPEPRSASKVDAEPSPGPVGVHFGPGGAVTAGSPRRPVAPFIALALGLVVAALVIVFANAKTDRPDSAATPLLNQPAPVIDVATMTGAPFRLTDRRGSWVALNFFSTTCTPCVLEHAELVRFAQQQSAAAVGQRTELITVLNLDSVANAKAFFAERGGGTWPVLDDSRGTVSLDFGISKVPETWVIDPNGVVRERIITTVTADGLSAEIARLKQVP